MPRKSETPDHPAVAAAKAELATAQHAVRQLERRVVGGDRTILPGEIGEAQVAVRYAELRVEAAERQVAEEEARREKAQTAAAGISSAIADLGGPLGNLEDLRRAAELALEDLFDAAEKHQLRVAPLIAGAAVNEFGVQKDDDPAPGVKAARTTEAVVVSVDPAMMLGAALGPVLRRHEVADGNLGAQGVTAWVRAQEAAAKARLPRVADGLSAEELRQANLERQERRRIRRAEAHAAQMRKLQKGGDDAAPSTAGGAPMPISSPEAYKRKA